ncbi:MAG TPA: acyltransferase family protein [Caulobacteraceae bacterium]|nr:acyltransferase family protein [Caulobacteraceae bacterium]
MTVVQAAEPSPHGIELALPLPTPAQTRPDYNVAVGYLRAFARLLVFMLHSAAAYYAGPHPLGPAELRMSIPIIDPKHFAGARILVAFNEISLMSLLFFLSGLFLWPSLTKKGAGRFLGERVVRLGLPYLVCGGMVAAIAYYPNYLVSAPAHPSFADYAVTWLTPGRWTTGPGWFLLILFVYDLVAVALFAVLPSWGRWLGDFVAVAAAKPLRFCLIAMAASAVAYVPLALALGPYGWWHIGAFWLQKSRTLHYAVYFFLGAGAGAFGLGRGLLSPGGKLAATWPWWTLAMVPTFLIAANLLKLSINRHADQTLGLGLVAAIGFVVCCAVCSFALMAIFVRFAKRSPLIDSFANNSYGMYLVHYMFVTWTQYALLTAPMSPIAKSLIVVGVTVGASWLLAASLRRIPAVARIV